jgi:two-component system, LytTR family, response regulator
MQIDCIIVEDEPLAQERLKTYITRLPFLRLMVVFENGIDALVFLKSNSADIIFLDINLGGLSGIQMLEVAKLASQVIITTAYDGYAIKGFELNVTDYLLKPFSFERFEQAVTKAEKNLSKKITSYNPDFVFIKTEYRLEKLLLNDVMYIEGVRDYRKIHTIAKKIMTLQTFTEFENDISPHIICRVHKSYMVSIDKIESVEKDRIKIKDVLIPISETYKKPFFDLLRRSGK